MKAVPKTEAVKRLRREIMLRHPAAFVFDDDGNILPDALSSGTVIKIRTRSVGPTRCRCSARLVQIDSELWRCEGVCGWFNAKHIAEMEAPPRRAPRCSVCRMKMSRREMQKWWECWCGHIVTDQELDARRL